MTLVPGNTSNTPNSEMDGNSERKVRITKKKSVIVEFSGGLSVDELALPGSELLSMLLRQANALGHNLGQMAKQLNVTYAYFAQLRSGKRKISDISGHFASACALYLGTPRLTILMASGRIKPEDYHSNPTDVIANLPRAIKFILDDPKYGPLVPISLIEGNSRLQYLIISLYEDATKTMLLPGRKSAEEMLDELLPVK